MNWALRSNGVGIATSLILAIFADVAIAQSFSPAEETTLLNALNQARATVSPPAQSMPVLTWGVDLKDTAQAWANTCTDTDATPGLLDHNPNPSFGYPTSVGENLYATSGGAATPQGAVSAWVSEKVNFNLATNSCSGVCGHYTQVVNAATTRVGCARSFCTSLEFPSTIVCDFAPGQSLSPPYVARSTRTPPALLFLMLD